MTFEKCAILRIGWVDDNGEPQQWAFDGQNRPTAGMQVLDTGEVLYGGWAVEELRLISHARNVEL